MDFSTRIVSAVRSHSILSIQLYPMQKMPRLKFNTQTNKLNANNILWNGKFSYIFSERISKTSCNVENDLFFFYTLQKEMQANNTTTTLLQKRVIKILYKRTLSVGENNIYDERNIRRKQDTYSHIFTLYFVIIFV